VEEALIWLSGLDWLWGNERGRPTSDQAEGDRGAILRSRNLARDT